jgi:4-amino-4-deoxychorismate lyase
MYPFLETIRFNSIIVPFIQEHQDRINRTFAFFYPEQKPLDLATILREIKANNQDFLLLAAVVKCRLCYNDTEYEYHLEPYQIKEIKSVVLKQVADDFDYTFKYADRTLLNDLKGSENEILIVKNGLITDTSYANIAFFDGKKWFTPVKPLLEGTKRSALLQHNIIQTSTISVADLQKFSHFKLFNAMIDWEESTIYDIAKIKL